MSKLEHLTRSIDHRLKRVERQLANPDGWLTRLMAPPRRGPVRTWKLVVDRLRNRTRVDS